LKQRSAREKPKVSDVKALFRIVVCLLVAAGALNAHAQRSFAPAELEALLAPVALYPDPLLQQILDASQYPEELAAAASWSRANPQLGGDAAVATVQSTPWHASVKALMGYPEVLARMDESPQWLHDLAEAYAGYGTSLMSTVQTLRGRAQASGYLQSNDQQTVTEQAGAIYVQPAVPNVVYVPYYNPYVVYGGWAWSAYRPPHWRPWVARAHHVAPHIVVRPYHRVPESRRQPFVHSGGGSFIHSAPAPRGHGANPFARSAPAPRAQGANPFLRR